MKKNLKMIAMAGFNLAVNTVAVMAASSSSQAAVSNTSMLGNNQGSTNTQVNSISMASIEKSFLEVPRMCKDRSAAFDPVPVGREEVPSQVVAIHLALDSAQGAVA